MFRHNNYTIIKEPRSCRNKTIDYLVCSDNIYEWLSTIYEKVDKIVEHVRISSIYDILKS
jgi:hypothetical protein